MDLDIDSTVGQKLHTKGKLPFEDINFKALLFKARNEFLKFIIEVMRIRRHLVLVSKRILKQHGIALNLTFQAELSRRHKLINSTPPMIPN